MIRSSVSPSLKIDKHFEKYNNNKISVNNDKKSQDKKDYAILFSWEDKMRSPRP
jgi:hypothetical protein